MDAWVIVEGRYRLLPIWITRLVMFGFTMGFLVMIWAIWNSRRDRPTGEPMVAGGA